MGHQIISPSLATLSDPALDLTFLVDGIVGLFGRLSPDHSSTDEAECAGRIYLAVMSAFQHRGFLKLSYTPNLWLEIGNEVYEVCTLLSANRHFEAHLSCLDIDLPRRVCLRHVARLERKFKQLMRVQRGEFQQRSGPDNTPPAIDPGTIGSAGSVKGTRA